MEMQMPGSPGYTECDFLLVLKPHEELCHSIAQIKEEFKRVYNCNITFGKPYITLVKFQQYEMMQPHIVQRLQNIATSLPVIKVELRNFGSLPSHTIYINITSKIPIINIVKAVRQAQSLMKIDKDRKPYFITDPHIPIARKLQPWQYEKAWLEYTHKTFTGRFIADKILLLKLKQGNKAYQTVESFAFKNQPLITTQGALF